MASQIRSEPEPPASRRSRADVPLSYPGAETGLSAASLWLHEGRTIIEVATWMGHSGSMALSTYLHVMSDMGDERVSAEEAIRAAREALVPPSYPRAPQNEEEADAE